MDRVVCSYHPRKPARWLCPRCEVDLCPACVRRPTGSGREHPSCPLCERPVEPSGLDNAIEPFWHRLHRIFAYPLQPPALFYLLGLGLLSLARALPLIGLLVGILAYLAIVQYSFRIMAHTASGHMQPPDVTLRSGEGVAPRIAALILVYIAVAFLTRVASHHLGLPGYLAVSAFFSLMLPASIMIIGLEQGFLRSPFKAVSPPALIALATRIGPAYLLLSGLVQLLSMSGDHLQRLLIPLVPEWAAIGVADFSWMYVHLVTYHLLGYVVYQCHGEEGLEVALQQDRSGGEPREAAADPGQSVGEQVDGLLQEGRLDRAEELLRERIDAEPADLTVWQRYYRVLQSRGDDARLVQESKDYISALLLAGRVGPALEVAADALDRDPGFRPAKAEQVRRLAEAAREGGRPRLALRLMDGFGRDHPGHEDLPALSVLAARIFSEDLDQDAKARPILEALLRKFPDRPEAAQARRLLRAIGAA